MRRVHHIIFEGAELSGKSFLLSQLYDFLEPKYNREKLVLDGCHWFNCDVGIFGTPLGRPCIERYVEMLKIMKRKNVLFEKFHLSDIVYHRLHKQKEVRYNDAEKDLKKLGAKIILTTFKEDTGLLRKRIRDRIALYPHYERILKDPRWYIRQQREYLKEIKKSALEHLIVDMTRIPGKNLSNILQWLHEK